MVELNVSKTFVGPTQGRFIGSSVLSHRPFAGPIKEVYDLVVGRH
jgi:hypothetical protein